MVTTVLTAMPKACCDECYEFYDDTNGYHTEDGKYRACSLECLERIEEDLEINRQEDQRREISRRYTS